MKQYGILLLAAAFAMVASVASAKRVALVLGNSKYEHAVPLKNPVNDATAMAEKFRSLGFETIEGYDLDYNGMRQTMRDFARKSRDAELATIFYAGHGISVDGANYLVPIDASLTDPIDWEFQVYNMQDFLQLVKYSKGASLIFLDACRDNPMAETLARAMGSTTRSVGGRGLARVDVDTTGTGMALAFATSPGEVAQDGEGDHSPFTTALLKHLGTPNVDISEVMSLVTGEVYEITDQKQRPWTNASLTGPVVLNRVDTSVLQPTTTAEAPAATQLVSRGSEVNASIDVQKFMFEAATNSGDAADFKAYLDLFPTGVFAQLARNAIKRIDEEAAPEAQPTVTAAVAPALVQGQARQPQATSATRSLQQPLQLTVTDSMRSMTSDATTEQLLLLDRNQRKAVQGRLNAIGINVGGADGSLGPKSRRGISTWQSQNGLTPTGYLNTVQLQMLTANTEAQYASYLASQPVRSTRRTTRRTTSTTSSRRTRSNNNAGFNALAVGIAAGLLLGKR